MKTYPNPKKDPNKMRNRTCSALAALLMIPAGSALAANITWIGATGTTWNNPGSWDSNSIPTLGDNAINNSGLNNVIVMQDGDPTWSKNDLLLGNATNTFGAFHQTGSTNNIGIPGGNWLRLGLGTGSGGDYLMDGGVLHVGGQTHIGEGTNAVATLTMNNGLYNNDGNFVLGDADFGSNPNGTFTMNGGTLNIGGELWIGEGHGGGVGGTGTMYMKGGSVNIGNWFAIGRFGGMADLEMTGGAITKTSNSGNITVATTPSIAVVNQNGGFMTNTASETWISESGDGTWNLNSGVDYFGVIHLTQNASAVKGVFNLNGGDLWATEISDNGGASGSFYFNGGTLHAATTSPNFIHNVTVLYVGDGGAKINTEGNDVTVNATLSAYGTGGLTKLGAGTLSFGSGYSVAPSGPVVVSQGTLALTTDNSPYGSYTVADNAGLNLGVASFAGASFYLSDVTLGSTSGASIGFDLGAFGNPTTAPLQISGALTLNGTVVVNITDAAPALGEFPLIAYGSKAGSGSFTLGTLPPGVVASLVPTATGLDLNITAVALDVWTAAANNNWDINTSINWINAGTSVATVYKDGDQVRFDDSITSSTNLTVNLVTNVIPGGSVNFNNATNSYTLTGSGSINGLIGINKSGANILTIANTNGYTGKTVISDGTLQVGMLANGGVPSPIGAATSSTNNLVFNGGTLQYTGPSMTWDRGYTLKANYGNNGGAGTNIPTLDIANDLKLTGQVVAAPTTAFVKGGLGTLTYAGTGTNQLSSGTTPGYQVYGGTLVFDGSAGAQVNHIAGECWVGDTTNSGANILLTNTTLNVDSWFSLSRGNGDSGYVCNGNMYNSTMNVGNFSLGWRNGRPNLCSQVWTMTNSILHDGGNFLIAESAGSVGTVNITGNSIVAVTGGSPMRMGLELGATGTVVVANNSIVTNNAWVSCGANGTGTLLLKDNALYDENGDFNFGDYGAVGTVGYLIIQDNAKVVLHGNHGTYVGKSGGSFGYVTQSSGLLDARDENVFQLGQAANTLGQYTQTGGTNLAGGWVSIGRGGDLTSVGIYDISAGLFEQTGTDRGLIVGEQGTGTLTIHGTAMVVSDNSNLGVAIGWNGGVGTLNLNGGTLVAKRFQSGTAAGSTGTLNLNGGKIIAGPGANRNFMTNVTTVNLMAATTIDSGTNTIAINQAITDAGGSLTKEGSGTLLLNGTYTFPTTITVNAGGLGGNGSIAGPLQVLSGASFTPGASIGTFTSSSTINLAAGSSTVIEVNNTNAQTSDKVAASGITYGGTLVMQNLGGALAVGDTFSVFSGAYSGSFTSVSSITPGQIVTWDTSKLNTDGSIKVLTVSAAAAPSITSTIANGNLTLSWPAGSTGYTLQVQTNSLAVGLSTNWVNVAGSSSTNSVTLPVDPTAGAVFYRLTQ